MDTIFIVPLTSAVTVALTLGGQTLMGFIQARTQGRTSETQAGTARYQAVLQHDIQVGPVLMELIRGLQARVALLEAQNAEQADRIEQLEKELEDERRRHV